MVLETLSTIFAAFLIAGLVYHFYPEQGRRFFNIFVGARRLIFGVFGFITALVFLRTGIGFLMVLGFIMFLYLGLYLLFKEPWEDVIDQGGHT
jgi:hypothetical protein